jgi:hypothetical protein
MALALALCLLGGAIFYVDLAGRRGQALPHWAPAEAAAWLRTNGSLAAAGGALAVGILGVLVAAGARRRPSAAGPPAEVRQRRLQRRKDATPMRPRPVDPAAAGTGAKVSLP